MTCTSSEVDRLVRYIRRAHLLTETLSVWTGRTLTGTVEYVTDPEPPDPELAAFLDSDRPVSRRAMRLHAGTVPVASATSWVQLTSAALTPQVRMRLSVPGALLGETLAEIPGYSRVTVSVTRLAEHLTGDPKTELLATRVRLDVAGTPVACCCETIHEGVIAMP
jgi:hypothetical protein